MVERFNGRIQREVLGITVASHRELETLLHGFNRAYNARRQRVLKGRSPERVVHERLGAVPTRANSSPGPASPKRVLGPGANGTREARSGCVGNGPAEAEQHWRSWMCASLSAGSLAVRRLRWATSPWVRRCTGGWPWTSSERIVHMFGAGTSGWPNAPAFGSMSCSRSANPRFIASWGYRVGLAPDSS